MGCGVGVLMALGTVHWAAAREALLPFAIAANSVPIIAFAPILNNWFGVTSLLSKMMIVAVITLFPMLINTLRGLTQVEPSALELMRSYAGSEWQAVRKVRVPNALPYMFNALKVCSALSLIGAVVGEFFGGPRHSLGVYITQEARLVNIAQVFQRSGTLEISWRDSGIVKPDDWRGKKVGTWGFGNEPELFAAMRKVGIDPNDPKQVTIIQQPFDMSLFLTRQVDAAQAMIYNEYAQVLEAVNPKTGQLFRPEDLHVIDFNDVGTAMLQDGIFVREDWIAEAKHRDIALKFLRGSIKGWVFCRDHYEECVDIVLKNGPTLGQSHMTWMLNEVNALIWPSPAGIGLMDAKAYGQTVRIARQYQIIKKQPDEGAYRTDLARKALDELNRQGLDTQGLGFKKRTVQLTKGGE